MPSIVIGGENTNVGLHALDYQMRAQELAMRQQELNARLAAMSNSGVSSASRASSWSDGSDGGFSMKSPSNANPAQMQAQPQQTAGGFSGLSDDYVTRIKQMQSLYAGAQNQQQDQRGQQLQGDIGSYDNSLQMMTKALTQAQDQDQVDGIMDNIRDLVTKKNKAMDEFRSIQSTPKLTGNKDFDTMNRTLASQARGQAQPSSSSADPYEALGKFYAQGVQAKNKEKASLKAEDDKRKNIAVAQKHIDDVQGKIKDTLGLLKGSSPEAAKELGDGADLAEELETATKAYDDLIGNKAHIDQRKNVMAMFKQAQGEASDIWSRKQAADQYIKDLNQAKLDETKSTNLAKKEEALNASRERMMSTLRTTRPESVEQEVNGYADMMRKMTGRTLSNDEKRGIMMANPSYAATENMLDRWRNLPPEQALPQAEAYMQTMNQLTMSSSTSSETGDARVTYKQSGWEKAGQEGHFDSNYVRQILEHYITSLKQKIGTNPNSAPMGVSAMTTEELNPNTGKPWGWDPEERTKKRARAILNSKGLATRWVAGAGPNDEQRANIARFAALFNKRKDNQE